MSIVAMEFNKDTTDEQAVFWLYQCVDEDVNWDERVSIMRGLENLYGGHVELRAKAEELAKKFGKKEEPDPFDDMWEV